MVFKSDNRLLNYFHCFSSYPSISVIFRPSRRISSLFSFKDRLPLSLRSYVIYKFTSRCCQASYVGETCRLIHTGISEHICISTYAGKALSHTTLSSVLPNKKQTGHDVACENFSILSSGSSQFDDLLRESLLI